MAAAEESEGFTSSEMGALAHLYRGEIYRSTIWRTRLDATTNWSVVSLGLALTISYASPEASAMPLLLVAALIGVFLYLEARRYRYFNVWRARARWIEVHFYAPLLRGQPVDGRPWQDRLAQDYERPEHHIQFRRALGRRLRRNYMWIFTVQTLALFGKVFGPAQDQAAWEALALGPLPGQAVALIAGFTYLALGTFTLVMWRSDKRRFKNKLNPISMG